MSEGNNHDHGEEVLEFSAKKAIKFKAVDPDPVYGVEGAYGRTFAIARTKTEAKTLMNSDAAVVYYIKKGKLYLNANGVEKGWGKKKVGGLVAKIKNKPELSACDFVGLRTHKSDVITGVGGETDTTDPLCSTEPARWRPDWMPNGRERDLMDANLQYADLRNADLQYANLRNTNLRNVDLRDAKLGYANLSMEDFRTGADLTNADLKGADLNHADLRDANLKGADLTNANLEGANLARANLRNTDFVPISLTDADLSGAILINANLRGAVLNGAKLSTMTHFQGADLTGASNLKQALNKLKLSAGGRSPVFGSDTTCPDGTKATFYTVDTQVWEDPILKLGPSWEQKRVYVCKADQLIPKFLDIDPDPLA